MLRLMSLMVAMMGLWLAGCATDNPHEKAGMRGYIWSFQTTPEEGAKLAYGVPASDQVALMMTCAPGSGAVQVSTQGAPGEALSLASDKAARRLPVSTLEGMPGEMPLLAASARANDPVLARFADSGRLQLTVGARSTAIDAVGSDRSEVKRFFAACV